MRYRHPSVSAAIEVAPSSHARYVWLLAIAVGTLACRYIDPAIDASRRRSLLRERYGFQCQCVACLRTDRPNRPNHSQLALSDLRSDRSRRRFERMFDAATSRRLLAKATNGGANVREACSLVRTAGIAVLPQLAPRDVIEVRFACGCCGYNHVHVSQGCVVRRPASGIGKHAGPHHARSQPCSSQRELLPPTPPDTTVSLRSCVRVG